AANGSPTHLAPTFPTPMPIPHSASERRTPSSGPVDPHFAGTPTPPDRLCRSSKVTRAPLLGPDRTVHEACAATARGRFPIADQAYRHPQGPVFDADTGASVARAVLAGGPPPTYPSPNWVQMQPSSAPTGRYGNAMAYDETRQQAVLFGGYDGSGFDNDTWTWNGSTWTQQHPATSPPARMWTQMAYDQATQTVILFGGGTTTSPVMNDTWSWNGTTWTQLSPATSPPGRASAAMTYDAQTAQVVLFGGGGYTPGVGASDLGDTWTFNGTTWTQVTATPSPAARSGARAAYDAVNHAVVLFGGQQQSGTFLGDTWTFNGSAWTQQSPAAAPSARSYEYLAADGGLPGVVLFGGYDPTMGDMADTWRWDGTGWAVASGIASPTGRDGGGMA